MFLFLMVDISDDESRDVVSDLRRRSSGPHGNEREACLSLVLLALAEDIESATVARRQANAKEWRDDA